MHRRGGRLNRRWESAINGQVEAYPLILVAEAEGPIRRALIRHARDRYARLDGPNLVPVVSGVEPDVPARRQLGETRYHDRRRRPATRHVGRLGARDAGERPEEACG